MRLIARAVTEQSGPKGIFAIVKQLTKTTAILDVGEADIPVLPLDEREIFTVDVELEKNHPFEARRLTCRATVSALTVRGDGQAEVYVAIREMKLQPAQTDIFHPAEGAWEA